MSECENDIKVANLQGTFYHNIIVVNYDENVTRLIHGGGLDKLHCLVITATLTDTSLKEYTCYVPGTMIILAVLCLH